MDLVVITTVITSLGGSAALMQVLRVLDRHLDRRLLCRVLDDHGHDEVNVIASALSQTRWKPATVDNSDEGSDPDVPVPKGDVSPKETTNPKMSFLQSLYRWLRLPKPPSS